MVAGIDVCLLYGANMWPFSDHGFVAHVYTDVYGTLDPSTFLRSTWGMIFGLSTFSDSVWIHRGMIPYMQQAATDESQDILEVQFRGQW